MEELLDTYQDYQPSERCFLDGRYIGAVLSEYPGYVHKPILVKVHEFDPQPDEKHEFKQEFHATVKSSTIRLNLDPEVPELIRVVIKVKQQKERHAKGLTTAKHSNLLMLDHATKTIYRFEPLFSFKFNDVVNDALELFFAASLPGYKFLELDNHPQKLEAEKCKSRGMCVAFVIKAGVQLALGRDLDFYDVSDPNDLVAGNDDINRLAAAVESLYTITGDKPDLEYGSGGAIAGAVIGGALIGGLGGVLLGGLAGNYVTNRYPPGYYRDPYYDPYYYGPSYGPRYVYTRGWGGGRGYRGGDRRGGHHGAYGGHRGGSRGGGSRGGGRRR